jgi:Tfp pilus assembly protein PilO
MRRIHFDIRQSGRVILTVLLAVLALNIGFYAFLVRPMIRDFMDLETQNKPRLEELEARKTVVEGKEAFVEALDKATDDLTTLREEVLSTRQRRLVVVQLEVADLARRFDINLKRVQYDHNLLEDEGLDRMVMVVPLKGGYANLRQFIRAVEDSDEFLVIERIALDREKQGGVLLQLNITLATYFDAPGLLENGRGGRRRDA